MATDVIQKIRVFKGSNGEWYVNLSGGNNEILFSSEGHKNKGDAVEIAEAVQAQMMGEPLIEVEGE